MSLAARLFYCFCAIGLQERTIKRGLWFPLLMTLSLNQSFRARSFYIHPPLLQCAVEGPKTLKRQLVMWHPREPRAHCSMAFCLMPPYSTGILFCCWIWRVADQPQRSPRACSMPSTMPGTVRQLSPFFTQAPGRPAMALRQ